jgi:hypothetical protein
MDNLKMMQTIYKNDHFKKLIEMIKNVDDTHEFEVSINRSEGITISQYIDIAKYLINMAKENDKYELSEETTLDISYAYSSNNLSNYRITIVGEDRINKIMSNLFIRKNHSIFSILTNNIMNKMDEQNLYIINKIKNRENIIDLNEYDIRIRLAEENEVPEKMFKELLVLTEVERNKIIFRFKERLSVLIHANEDYDIRIDLTNIKQNMAFSRLDNSRSIYELELEIIKNKNSKTELTFGKTSGQSPDVPTSTKVEGKTKSKSKNDNQIIEDTYNRLFFEIYNIHQLLQKSNKVLTLNSKQNVITTMNQLLYNSATYAAKDLPGMNVTTLENQHVTSDLTNHYSVTDKADGERYFLLISNGKIYLISNILEVNEIDNSLYTNLDAYNNTILDGEYIFLREQNKFLYLSFDILFYKGKDLRDEPKLESRIEKMNNVMKECFKVEYMTNKFSEKDTKLESILTYYKKNIGGFFKEMNTKLSKQNIVIMCKTFFIPLGIYQSEVYAYSEIIWNLYTKDKSINCPYSLDGIIYTGLNQKYTRSLKDLKYPIYKWKPSSMNSIDFYVKFERNPENQQILNVYDNSFVQTSLLFKRSIK